MTDHQIGWVRMVFEGLQKVKPEITKEQFIARLPEVRELHQKGIGITEAIQQLT